MNRVLGAAAASLALFVGCSKAPEPGARGGQASPAAASSSAASAPATQADRFTYAQVVERAGAVPERLRPVVPRLPRGVWPKDAPSEATVRDALCWGDAAARESFLKVVSAAGGSDAIELQRYRLLIHHCSESLCDWAAGVVTSDRAPEVREVVWSALPGCEGDRFDALFDRPDAPTELVYEHVREGQYGAPAKRRAWPRLLDHLQKVEGQNEKEKEREKQKESETEIERVLDMLQKGADTASRDHIVKRHDELRPGSMKSIYGRAACTWPGDAAAARACASACKPDPKRAQCSAKDAAPPIEPWPADIAAAACDGGTELSFLAADHPSRKSELSRAIGACLATEKTTAGGGDRRGLQFLRERLLVLGELDLGSAHAAAARLVPVVAKAAPGSEATADLRRLRSTLAFLTHFRSAEQITKELRDHGFAVSSPDPKSIPVLDYILADIGAMVMFDPETGTWPNAHDHLARTITRVVARDVEGVVFEEVAEFESGPYLLRAYVDGKILETPAQDLHDWYDVDAVVGLVNVVLRARKSTARAVVTDLVGNDGTILTGPAAGIEWLIAEGMIAPVHRATEAVEVEFARERELMQKILEKVDKSRQAK